MNKLDAILIGAGRSGTTSFCQYLKPHAQINFSSIKEVHYFSLMDQYERGPEFLHSFFSDDQNDQIAITSDTYLLPDRNAPKRLKEYNPGMKIIILLRDPVERSISSYRYAIHNGYHGNETQFRDLADYEKPWIEGDNIIDINNHAHLYGSLYFKHISFWGKYFEQDRILILTLDELKNSPDTLLEKTAGFLGIQNFDPIKEKIHANPAMSSQSKGFQQFLANRNHPVRKFLAGILRPFRKTILKSDLAGKLKKINQKEAADLNIPKGDLETVKNYFSEDLKNMHEFHDIRFGMDED